MKILLTFSIILGCCTSGFSYQRPNIVFIITDDQDADVNTISAMPKLLSLVRNKGAAFVNSFVANPLCCPSRASVLTGQHIHNHRTFDNSVAGGCVSANWQDGPEKRTFPVLLQNSGYATFYAGKYLNNYGRLTAPGGLYVPPGWSSWFANQGNSVFYNYNISVNGVPRFHGNSSDDYLTNVIEREALNFIEKYTNDKPFFMMLAPSAPHFPYTPEPKYKSNFSTASIPKYPNFNIANKNKNWFLQYGEQPLIQNVLDRIEEFYKDRLRSLISVDDMVESVIRALKNKELLENTYIFYTSDHGYHLGQFSLPIEKSQPYESDIRVPLIVRGPGISEGIQIKYPTTNIDLAPTFLDIAGISIPKNIDGCSLKGLMVHGTLPLPTTERAILIEHTGQGVGESISTCEHLTGLANCHTLLNCKCTDSGNNTYNCVRNLGLSKDELYCLWEYSFEEYYDLKLDPYQITNSIETLDEDRRYALKEKLNTLVQCSGTSCHM